MSGEEYDKKYELISETYEFSKTTLREMRMSRYINGFNMNEAIAKLEECITTMRRVSCEALNEAFKKVNPTS